MTTIPPRPDPPLPIAVSDCLLGHEVRYDGGHKRSSLPHDVLAGLFDYRGLCPEVAIGLGVPRAPIRLVARQDDVRAVVADGEADVTAALADHAADIAAQLDDACGYLFMKNSPSCGLFRVKVYPERGGAPAADGRGVFAREITRRLPQLPVEESGRMFDPVLRENFVTRVFAYAHWLRLVQAGVTAAALIEFHSRYKYLLMAHSVPHYQQAGRLLSDLSTDPGAVAQAYLAVLIQGLSKPATPGGHANVLHHLAGYVKRHLDAGSRGELADVIASYRRGEVPLLAAVTLLQHHLGRYPDGYALKQAYLMPHPPAQGLRRAL